MKASEIVTEVGIKSGLKRIASGDVLGGTAQTLGGLAAGALAPLHWYGGGKLGTAPALTQRQRAEQKSTQERKAERERLREIPVEYTEKINDLLQRGGINPYKSIASTDSENYTAAAQIIQNFILGSELARGDGKFDYRTEEFIRRRLADELSNIPMPTTINQSAIKNYITDVINERTPIMQTALQIARPRRQASQQTSQQQTSAIAAPSGRVEPRLSLSMPVQAQQPPDLSGAQVIRPTDRDPNTYIRYNNFVYALRPGAGGQWVSQRGLPINAEYNSAFNQLI